MGRIGVSRVRQVDALSVTLFNWALHSTVKSGTLANKTWQICAYADAVIMAKSEADLKKPLFWLSGELAELDPP